MTRSLKRALFVPLALLLVPLVAMQFTPDVQWSAADFLVAAVLLFGASLSIYLVSSRIKSPDKRTILIAAIVLVVVLLWAEMAVGLFGSPLAGS